MHNFVQRVFVGKATSSATAVSIAGTAQTPATPIQIAGQPFVPSTLQLGDLLLVDENGVILDAATAGTAQRARVVRGVGSGKVVTSSIMIKGTQLTRYTIDIYTAPVAQVSTFSGALLNLQPNTQYQLQVVIPQDLPILSNRQSKISVGFVTGATVGAADITRLIANFNRQREGLNIITATATGDGLGIILTGKTIPTMGIADYEFVRFDANFITLTRFNATTNRVENLITPTAVQPVTIAAQGGRGVAVQVRQLERVALGYAGFTDPRNAWYKQAFPYGAVDGLGYDILNVQQHISGEGMLQDTKTYPVSTLIATVFNGAQGSGFKTLLDAFIGFSPE